MRRTLKDSKLKSRNEIRFCFFFCFSCKVLGYPKELENVMCIFPACYGMRQNKKASLVKGGGKTKF